MQSDGASCDIVDLDVEAAWRGFGWTVIACDGHDVGQLIDAFRQPQSGAPRVIVASTVKGRGVSFMEHARDWHHNRLTADLYPKALADLNGTEAEHGI